MLRGRDKKRVKRIYLEGKNERKLEREIEKERERGDRDAEKE